MGPVMTTTSLYKLKIKCFLSVCCTDIVFAYFYYMESHTRLIIVVCIVLSVTHTHEVSSSMGSVPPCSVIKSLYLKSLEYMQPTKLGVIRADLVISTSIVTLERDENTLLYGRRFEHAKRITMRIVSNKHFFNIF